jgi:hypothetical protein
MTDGIADDFLATAVKGDLSVLIESARLVKTAQAEQHADFCVKRPRQLDTFN